MPDDGPPSRRDGDREARRGDEARRARVTLILNALAQEFVVQVSDRRLVDLWTKRILPQTANKSVLFCGHVAFGYTGLAEIEKTSTDRWLAAHLISAGPSAQASLERVKDEATKAFRAHHRAHAFAGVGWSKSRPILIVISNLADPSDGGSSVRPVFSLRTEALPATAPCEIFSVGQPLPPGLRAGMRRTLRRAIGHGVGPHSAARLVVAGARKVAAGNRNVGDDLMVSVLPRAAVPVAITMGITGGEMVRSASEASFYYVPSPTDDTPRFYTPLSACGGVAGGGGEVWVNRKPPWWT